MEKCHQHLFSSVELYMGISNRSWHDVTLSAGYAGMRRAVVSTEFRLHHVASRSAERYGVHIGNAPIAGCSDNGKVNDRGYCDEVQALAKHRVFEADLGKKGWHLFGCVEIASPDNDPGKNEAEPSNKDAGRMRSKTMSRYGLEEPPWPKTLTTQKPIRTIADAVVIAPPSRLRRLFP